MELEYGSDRYDLGNGSHGDHRSGYVYCISLFHIMQRIATIIFSALVLISIDYFSKWIFNTGIYQDLIAECPLSYYPDCLWKYYPILGQYFGFQLSYNSGIAFWLPITGLPLQIITIALIFWLLWYYFVTEYPKKSKLLDAGYALIMAGAISHAYERIFVGHVIDFIAVQYFAILNFADIFISIGAALLFIAYYVRKQ